MNQSIEEEGRTMYREWFTEAVPVAGSGQKLKTRESLAVLKVKGPTALNDAPAISRGSLESKHESEGSSISEETDLADVTPIATAAATVMNAAMLRRQSRSTAEGDKDSTGEEVAEFVLKSTGFGEMKSGAERSLVSSDDSAQEEKRPNDDGICV